jgi:hypothetical protein
MAIKFMPIERKWQRWPRRENAPLLLVYLLILCLVGRQLQGRSFYGQRYLEDVLPTSFSSDFITNNHRTNIVDCKTARGKSGRWVQDWDMANRTHYALKSTYTNWHEAERDFAPSPDEPFRWPTSWKWQDDHCPVAELSSRNEFCDVIWELDIRRFLIIGDSLSIEFGISFMSLLGQVPNRPKFNSMFRNFEFFCPFTGLDSDEDKNATKSITKSRPAFEFTVLIVRRSPISDLQAMCKTAEARTSSNKAWDTSYRKFVLADEHKTAIVFNTGAWIQEGLEEYKTGFHCMVDWIDSLQPSHDSDTNRILAFFRPTNRPNFDCLPQETNSSLVRQSPHTSLDEYYAVAQIATKNDSIVSIDKSLYKTENGVTFSMNWMYIEAYNDYSRQFLEDRQQKQHHQGNSNSSIAEVPIYWLNTYYSTALRRDGHVGFGDCLHYSLPGPTDSWVHFFYSLLLDLQQEEQNNQALVAK